LAGVGNGLTNIFTVLVAGGHTPLVIVHIKVLVPVIKLVTTDVLSVGVVTDEPPANTDHAPVPIRGELPASTVVSLHKF